MQIDKMRRALATLDNDNDDSNEEDYNPLSALPRLVPLSEDELRLPAKFSGPRPLSDDLSPADASIVFSECSSTATAAVNQQLQDETSRQQSSELDESLVFMCDDETAS
jgi:hypothetical protein